MIHDLDIIYQRAHQWKMEFNPDPTNQATEVLFTCKKSSPNHPHLNEKIIKAKKNVGVLKHLSKFLPLKTLDQMFKALVRSHLDYCDIIYHISSFINQPLIGVS